MGLRERRESGAEVMEHVLVVDDDPFTVRVVGERIIGLGHPVRAALNGREALEALARARPALILVDMQMPIMGGLEFLIRLRAELGNESPPVVLVSGSPPSRAAKFPGVVAVLSKTGLLEALPKILAMHLPAREEMDAARVDEILQKYLDDIDAMETAESTRRTRSRG